MQTIRITTSQNIDIDYELAGLGERMLAWLIDFAIFFSIAVMCFVIAGSVGRSFRDIGWIAALIAYILLFVFYDLICEIFMNGQSIGKRSMKIKVISLDGGQASVGQYFLRWIFRIIDFTLTSGACAIISASVTKNGQRVGDIVAGTILIRTEPRTLIDAIAFAPHKEDYVPIFNEVTQLRDKDIVLIHEVLTSYIKSGNTVILHNTAVKLRQLLKISAPMDDMVFLQTLVRDYNHLAAGAESA
ncbi:RDD family protein [Mucilaginibacter sp. UR6-11]|uniref:RDD family protein n=1 Tax=Mucilaginibacter sp. UR6-11 TaxID=1435644 RepID=UPI001E41E5AE|nr:RDD family protein [Mucilaginibacter sp. UR6-11]MCC8425201.1 RDD family protein [Mucilaginibacter sp. UR6-11]